MLIILQDTSIWERLADRYGIPLVGVVLLALFIWKVLWPFVLKQIETAQEALRQQAVQAQTAREQAHTARESALKEFLTALERRDDKFSEVVDVLDKLTDEVRRIKR